MSLPEIKPRHRVEIGDPASMTVILAGCGGTGSFAALHLARIAYEVKRQGGPALQLVFVDPDHVEQKNIGRQNFCPAEIGQPKAYALASRYNLAFGLKIDALRAGIGASKVIQDWRKRSYRGLAVVIGAVDSPAARREIEEAVKEASWGGQRNIWWLDSGNDEHSGQVLLGNGTRLEIDPALGCLELPWPGVQEPGIVTSSPAPAASDGLSCAELLALNMQSLMINQAMAGWIGVYASRLLLSRDLDIYQTWVDLRSGTARSEAVTGEAEMRGPEVGDQGSVEKEREIGLEGGAVGTCPQCNAYIFEGRDVLDVTIGEVETVFCPACGWQLDAETWQVLQDDTETALDLAGEEAARAAMIAGVRPRRAARAIGLVEEVVNV